MNYKQALAVLSDFLMKCEEEGVALPTDPLDAVIAAIRALDHEAKHEIGRRQMESALVHMREQCGVVKQDSGRPAAAAPAKPTPRRKKGKEEEEEESSSEEEDVQEDEEEEEEQEEEGSDHDEDVPTPQKSKKPKPPVAKKGKLQNEIASKPAKCTKNQALVNQLAQLGDYEMKHGHTQRGIARLRAAKEVRDTADAITSGAQARKLDRVGQSAAAKIDAILHGGLQNALREYTSD